MVASGWIHVRRSALTHQLCTRAPIPPLIDHRTSSAVSPPNLTVEKVWPSARRPAQLSGDRTYGQSAAEPQKEVTAIEERSEDWSSSSTSTVAEGKRSSSSREIAPPLPTSGSTGGGKAPPSRTAI